MDLVALPDCPVSAIHTASAIGAAAGAKVMACVSSAYPVGHTAAISAPRGSRADGIPGKGGPTLRGGGGDHHMLAHVINPYLSDGGQEIDEDHTDGAPMQDAVGGPPPPLMVVPYMNRFQDCQKCPQFCIKKTIASHKDLLVRCSTGKGECLFSFWPGDSCYP